MEILLLKIRIAVLWIFMAVAMSASMVLWFMGPGAIDEIMSGTMEGLRITTGLLLFFSLFWLIPLAMAFLSITLKDVANRKVNIILGIIFAVFYIGHLFMHLIKGPLTILIVLMCILMIILPVLIFWYAWKWPKQKVWIIDLMNRKLLDKWLYLRLVKYNIAVLSNKAFMIYFI